MTDPLASNVVAIGAALDAPVDAPAMAKPGDQAPFGGRDEDDELDRPRVPKDCPVKALGLATDGQSGWYLNVLGQLVMLSPRDHGKNNLRALFTPRTGLLEKYWPRWSAPTFEGRGNARVMVKPSEIIGFDQDQASEALYTACGSAGIFDARGRVRGRGAHAGTGGALILHTGDKVMHSARHANGKPKAADWHDPGLIERFVYPAAAPTPRPWHEIVGEDAGETLLALLSTWNWARPTLDPMLALGWACQGFVCGALDWRSHLFVTGGAGTGKSTLNGKGGVFDRLLGAGVMRTGNASEAAVRQTLGAQTIPVIFDEFEPNEFNGAKTKAVIELARVASSGTEMHRGGQDHKAHEFVLQSAFQFSAILMPKMETQDRSRFAVLELNPFAANVRPLDLDAAKLPQLGQKLMRRMVDGWPRFAVTYRAYHQALAAVGHSSRACDQFGTLLACADLALYDHAPTPDLVKEWARACDPEGLAEVAESSTEHGACLTHIVTSQVQARGGEDRQTIGAWIGKAVKPYDFATDGEDHRKRFRRLLQEYGLKVVTAKALPPDDRGRERWGTSDHIEGTPAHLAISNSHRALTELFRDSKWREGGWTQALGRSPDALRGVKVKFGYASERAVLVPLDQVLDDVGGAS